MSEGHSETDLIQRAIRGDRGSLSQLLFLHYDELHRFVDARISVELKALQRPDDILQQTFVRAANSVGRFEPRGTGSFLSWLRTIAANLIRDAEKRRSRERRIGTAPAMNGSSANPRQAVDHLVGDITSPSRKLLKSEGIQRIKDAIERLPDDQRDVIILHYLQHLTLEEIARRLNRSKDSVRGICYRARKNLRSLMGGSSAYFSG